LDKVGRIDKRKSALGSLMTLFQIGFAAQGSGERNMFLSGAVLLDG
jgi:hypothetical protein